MNDRYKFRVWNDMQKCYSQDDHYIDEDGQLNTNGKYIVEQCTGLKDKNGNLIFEGDICRITGKYWDCEDAEEKSVNEIDTVKSLEEFFGEAMVKGIYTALFCETLKVEVIGNIHENPELLEVGGEWY